MKNMWVMILGGGTLICKRYVFFFFAVKAVVLSSLIASRAWKSRKREFI